MKTQVTRVIDGEEKTITINPKYAGTSQKPADIPSSARRFIVRHAWVSRKQMLRDGKAA